MLVNFSPLLQEYDPPLLCGVALLRARDHAKVLFGDLMGVSKPAAADLLHRVTAAANRRDPPVL
jgi:hypothetical protein